MSENDNKEVQPADTEAAADQPVTPPQVDSNAATAPTTHTQINPSGRNYSYFPRGGREGNGGVQR